MNALEEPSIEDRLQAARQKQIDLLQKTRDAAREFESLDAKIKGETAKLHQHLEEIDRLKAERKLLERLAPNSVVHEQFLRQNAPPWVAARQRELADEARQLHQEFQSKSETREWLVSRLSYPPRGTQEELEVATYRKRLTIVDDEMAKMQARVREIRETESGLVARLIAEAWPNGPHEEAPKAAAKKR